MTQVHGTYDDRFAELSQLLQKHLSSGIELGASIAVNINGKNVVDIWGGYASADKSRPWEEDTIVNVWSSSKTVLSLAAFLLIDRGQLDPFEKVSKYWPEFGVNGKENIEVRHVLSHTSGLSGWEEKMTMETIIDTEKSTAMLAKQAPFWEPGTASGYHSLTMGHLVGELVRRVSGKSIDQFIHDELVGPSDVDFQLGAAEKDYSRIAEIIPPPPPEDPSAIPEALKDPTSTAFRTLFNPMMDASIANTKMWRDARVSAANGHTNARAMARLLSNVSLAGSEAPSLLKRETVDLIFREQAFGMDKVMGRNLKWGIGYALTAPGTALNFTPEGNVCRWGGWGGSMVVMDVDRGLTIAYMMNRMGQGAVGDTRTFDYVSCVYRALGVDV